MDNPIFLALWVTSVVGFCAGVLTTLLCVGMTSDNY